MCVECKKNFVQNKNNYTVYEKFEEKIINQNVAVTKEKSYHGWHIPNKNQKAFDKYACINISSHVIVVKA